MYNSDKPISNQTEDLLGRKGFSKQLAKAITLFNNVDTFTIALYGKWGSGKTSVINMMINEIKVMEKEENIPIIFNFTPWNFYNTNQLLNQFFIQLSNILRSKKSKDLSKIGEALEKYSDAFELTGAVPIFGVFGGLVGYAGKQALSLVGKKLNKNTTDISKQKDDVINLLKQQSKKILVIIDDMDRLSNEQIRQVFQLITSVAKFPNMIYLLAFDRDIIVKALETIQEGNGDEYLKKIIQIPIQLPEIDSNSIKRILYDKLQNIINNVPKVNFNKDYWQMIFEPCIYPLINNLRDINQLCNSVYFKLISISSEVDFADMVAISALEMNYNEIFEWIRENKSILTGSLDFSLIGTTNRSQEEWKNLYYDEISILMNKSENGKDLSKSVDFMLDYLSYLFPYFGNKIGKVRKAYNSEELRLNNRIGHEAKFDRYFHLNIDKLLLKSDEIKNAIYAMQYDDLIKFLLEKDKEALSYEFFGEILANMNQISSQRAELLAKVLFETAYQFEIRYNMFQLNIKSYAQLLIRELMDIIKPENRMSYIRTLLEDASLNQLQTFADFFNITELSYGRLAANGEREEYKKLITLAELEELEKEFCAKIKELSTKYNILDFSNARMYIYLFERLDVDYFETYMRDKLILDENKIKYLSLCVSEWIGDGIGYEANDDFKKFLLPEDVINAVERLKFNKKYFNLPLDIQRRGVALYLKITNSQSYFMGVSQKEIDGILASWKS